MPPSMLFKFHFFDNDLLQRKAFVQLTGDTRLGGWRYTGKMKPWNWQEAIVGSGITFIPEITFSWRVTRIEGCAIRASVGRGGDHFLMIRQLEEPHNYASPQELGFNTRFHVTKHGGFARQLVNPGWGALAAPPGAFYTCLATPPGDNALIK